MIRTPHHFGPASSARGRGFALIISLVLMGFILLLLLSLSALTRVETTSVNSLLLREQARMNAQLGLNLAIGQLQELAGADRRVTATAAIERNDTGAVMTPADGARHWTGVWGHGGAPQALKSTPVFLNWLVSGNAERRASPDGAGTIGPVSGALTYKPDGQLPAISTATQATDTLDTGSGSWRLLVGGNSVSGVGDYVVAPFVPLHGAAGSLSGGYAYWIGDEGVKAALHAVEEDAVLYPPEGDQEEKLRLRYRTPGRSGVEGLAENWLPDLAVVADPDSAPGAQLRSQLARLVQTEQLNLLNGVPGDFVKDHFHDMTAVSYGVLANTLAGGLRKDLTAGFAPGTTVNSRPEKLIWEQIKDEIVPGLNYGPAWHTLRTWYQFADTAGDTLPITKTDWDGRHPLSPVVVGWQWFVQALVQETAGGGSGSPAEYRLGFRMYPALVLWNPYNVKLKGETLGVAYTNHTIPSPANRRIVFATRVWAAGGSRDNAYPAAFTEHAQYIAPWSEVHTPNTASKPLAEREPAPLRLTVETGDMEPGMAYVYTMKHDVAYTDATDAATYRMARGWNFDGSKNAAIYAWSANVFALPAGQSAADYRIGFWVSSSDLGGNLANYEWDKEFSGLTSGNSASYGIIGNDAFELDVVATGGTLRLQSIYGINASLRSIQAQDMWSESGASLLSDVISQGSVGFYGQRWELKVTEAAAIYQTAATGGEQSFNDPVRWLANYNPRAGYSDRTAFEDQEKASDSYYNTNPAFNRVTTLGDRIGKNFDPAASWFLINHDIESGAAYTGISQNGGAAAPEPVILFDVPRPNTRPISLGALQHAAAFRSTGSSSAGWATATAPAYPIGNSLADPRVALDTHAVRMRDITNKSGYSSNDYLFDYSYLLNRSLWDGYYFSSVPQGGGAVTFPLANARYVAYGTPEAASLRNYDQSAANLLVKGAFNINSTSEAAWRALLASFNGVPVNGETMNGKSAYPRFPAPEGSFFDAGNTGSIGDASANADAYNSGFRGLTQAQIDRLAQEIVTQVRQRGPFLSMADFVNRSLGGPQENQLMGALATALEKAGINDGFKTYEVSLELKDQSELDGSFNMVKEAYDGVSAAHVPGWLSQADLLQSLSPVLSARSDTFVIRVCGEASLPGDADSVARAWCEAVVQRLPDYRNGDAAWAAPTADNQSMGRSFRIVSLRWLSADEI